VLAAQKPEGRAGRLHYRTEDGPVGCTLKAGCTLRRAAEKGRPALPFSAARQEFTFFI